MNILRSPFALLSVLLWITANRLLAADGAALFKQHCALCHGKDGKADTPAAKKFGAKDLSASKTEDAEIIRQIREGKRDDKGKQLMPAFGEKLSADDVTALLEQVKSFRKP